MFRVAAESAKRMVRLSGGCWALKSEVSREPICHEDLVNVGKLQQVFLYLFTNYADKTSSVNPGLYHLKDKGCFGYWALKLQNTTECFA